MRMHVVIDTSRVLAFRFDIADRVHAHQFSSVFIEKANIFFSSRRLHTILTCDWSSDVCSSDLPVPGVTGDGVQVPPVLLDVLAVVALRAGRSEERRVGKECRSRWAASP